MNRALVFAIVLVLPAAAALGAEAGYLREHIYDTAVGPDEALVNVSLANHRWPDCSTLESAVNDIFRLEGVADRSKSSDQDRALALWKWFRILVSSTGGGYMYEGPPGKGRHVTAPHKIFTVYGHHQCDGLSWAMVPLWRAAGYMAFDTAHHGHTTASLRYRDADGEMRYHSLDPQHRDYYWDAGRKRLATRSFPLITGMVNRHLLTPRHLHSLRTSLREGETVERLWNGAGAVMVAGRLAKPNYPRYYAFPPQRTRNVYTVAGEQVQTLHVRRQGGRTLNPLAAGSFAAASSEPKAGLATFHPAKAGQEAFFVYRLAKPFVLVEADIEATLVTTAAGDVCRIAVSRDGNSWQRVLEKTRPGRQTVKIAIGKAARLAGKPDVFTAYDVYVRLECKAASAPRGAGFEELKITTRREFNKRTQPNLRPGENVFRVTAEKLSPGKVLALEVDYEFKGKRITSAHTIASFPYYFRVDVPGWKLREIKNYDYDFNNEAARMLGYRLALAPAAGRAVSAGVPASEAEGKFAESDPHPADMTHRAKPKAVETDPIQTNGFFPQSRARKPADANMHKLIAQLKAGADRSYKAWHAAQQLGDYPEAVDVLNDRLKTASLDLTLFICKALAQIADPKSLDPLLKKWETAPRGAPGTRYIPDCFAAIGDRRAVKPMIAKLKLCRFDFRFHIAHALGVLGGKDAEEALADLAKNDPFPAVREEAIEALKKLRK